MVDDARKFDEAAATEQLLLFREGREPLGSKAPCSEAKSGGRSVVCHQFGKVGEGKQ